uniref:ATP synthase complex subunit 8 n=1 Tax=Takydromus sexlineatus TaxID=118848 RepID=U3NFX7_9SAUR|nr:ATP synthase F0 subunit 8 [Takydromus sexlineatus]AGW31750.1 ATP synthase F0 subunit 8 [Takydromus sexlineatus]
MPQLNPNPWFMIFLLTWMTLLTTTMKILNSNPKLTTPQYTKQLSNSNWIWPWS